jgi:hypothetical protein
MIQPIEPPLVDPHNYFALYGMFEIAFNKLKSTFDQKKKKKNLFEKIYIILVKKIKNAFNGPKNIKIVKTHY